MSTEKKIKERLDQAVIESHFKPWYQRLTGRIILAIAGVFILLFLYLSWASLSSLLKINNGDVFDKTSGAWISYEDYQAHQKDVSEILTEDDPFLGTDEPLVYIVAYESFSCPYCKSNQADLKKMMEKFSPIVRFVFKDFPTESLHPNVFQAHVAAGCAQAQNKFWEYHDVLFANQENIAKADLKKYAQDLDLDMTEFNTCFTEEKPSIEIRQDYAQGVNLGVYGTPSYVVNGQLISGEVTFDVWEQIIGFIIKEEI